MDITLDITGSAVSSDRIDALLKHFKTVMVSYGATETTKTTIKPITDPGSYTGSVGSFLPGTEWQLTDDNELLIKTAGMISGYLGAPELTAKHFRDGWFYTGDIVAIENNELYIKGRNNDTLNIGGVKIDPQTIDSVIKSVAGIRDAMTFQHTDFPTYSQLQALIVLDGVDFPEAELKKTLIAKFGMTRMPRRVYIVDKIPVNANGKPDRKLAMAKSQAYDVIQIAKITRFKGNDGPTI
jgi:acyl-CoA synthetase (AMP-forming)/AMP-acid ligase II